MRDQLAAGFIVISPLELSANAFMTVSIFFAGRNSVHTWWSGIVGCLLFGLLFHEARLYADVALQGFFVVTSLLGWWQWLRGNLGAPLAVSRSGTALVAGAVLAGLVTAVAYGAILYLYTDAYAPFVDSIVLTFSVIAQILLMRRHLESWAFWLLVNSLAIPLYASRELYLTTGLYCVYWVNACLAWAYWKRQLLAGQP
jgi:nicotinamide mononucleotide transporter